MVRRDPVYLDYHATTPTDPRVVDEMLPFFSTSFGNPSSATHQFGSKSRDRVQLARESVAGNIGAEHSEEIVFTSGATESNNLAIRGLIGAATGTRNEVISCCTEHHSVLDVLPEIKRSGGAYTLLRVHENSSESPGRLDLGELESVVASHRPRLVSIMYANNVIGTVQPIGEIVDICHKYGALVHCDATQAAGLIPLNVASLGVDSLSLSGHKIYGPKGIGALYVRGGANRKRLKPLIYGGGQEFGIRGGTLNVPAIIGFARALEVTLENLSHEVRRLTSLRDRLYSGLKSRLDNFFLIGYHPRHTKERLVNNLTFGFHGVRATDLLHRLPGVALSTGSACTSNLSEPSHVFVFLGLNNNEAASALRASVGRFTTEDEIDFAVGEFVEAVNQFQCYR